MKKKNMALALSLIMIAGSLVACGKKGGDKSSVPASTSEIHTHSYGAWEDTKPATHTAEGEQTRTCACGEKETRTVAKTSEHEYGEWTVTKPATHTEEGEETRTCACGDKETRPVAKTTDHEFGDWAVTKPATHTEEGEETRTCACGEKETRTVANIADHEWSEWQTVKAATCTVAGEEKRTCACGAKETRPVAATGEHQYGDWSESVAATCETAGTEHRTCKVCGNEETRDGAVALGHEASTEWSSDDTNHWHACTHDASHKLDEAAHIFNKQVVKPEALMSTANPCFADRYYVSCECGQIKKSSYFTVGKPVAYSSYSWELEPTETNYGLIRLKFEAFNDMVFFIPELGNETFWKAETVSTEGGTNKVYSFIAENTLTPVKTWVDSVWDDSKAVNCGKLDSVNILKNNASLGNIKYTQFNHTTHVYSEITGECKFCEHSQNIAFGLNEFRTISIDAWCTDILKVQSLADLEMAVFLKSDAYIGAYIEGVYRADGTEVNLGDRNVFSANDSEYYYVHIANKSDYDGSYQIAIEQHDTDALFVAEDVFSINGRDDANIAITGRVHQGTVHVGDTLHYYYGDKALDITVASIEKFHSTQDSATEGEEVGIAFKTDLERAEFSQGAQLTAFRQHMVTTMHVNSHLFTLIEGGRRTPIFDSYKPYASTAYNGTVTSNNLVSLSFPDSLEIYQPGEAHIVDLTFANAVSEITLPYYSYLTESGKQVAEIAMIDESIKEGDYDYSLSILDTVDGTVIDKGYWLDWDNESITENLDLASGWVNLEEYIDNHMDSQYSWYYRPDVANDFGTIVGRGTIVYPQTTSGKLFKGKIYLSTFQDLIGKKAEVTFQTTVDGETTTEVREIVISFATTADDNDMDHSGNPGFVLRGLELADAANIVKIAVKI